MIPRFEDVFPLLPVNGWLSEAEARCLWSAALTTEGPILEIGCYYGRASVLLASLGRPLYCVDPFSNFDSDHPDGDAIERRWRANLAAYPNATLFRRRVEEWTPRPVGFAYCDGDHTGPGTRAQVEAALACGAKVICVHDVNDRGDGVAVRDAAVALLGPWATRVERLAVWEVKQ